MRAFDYFAFALDYCFCHALIFSIIFAVYHFFFLRHFRRYYYVYYFRFIFSSSSLIFAFHYLPLLFRYWLPFSSLMAHFRHRSIQQGYYFLPSFLFTFSLRFHMLMPPFSTLIRHFRWYLFSPFRHAAFFIFLSLSDTLFSPFFTPLSCLLLPALFWYFMLCFIYFAFIISFIFFRLPCLLRRALSLIYIKIAQFEQYMPYFTMMAIGCCCCCCHAFARYGYIVACLRHFLLPRHYDDDYRLSFASLRHLPRHFGAIIFRLFDISPPLRLLIFCVRYCW